MVLLLCRSGLMPPMRLVWHSIPQPMPRCFGRLGFPSWGCLPCHLREDLLHDGAGKATPAQEGPEFLAALGQIGFTDQAGPALRSLRPRCRQPILGSDILLPGL